MLGAAFQQIGITSTTVTNAGFLTALYVPLVPLLCLADPADAATLVGLADIDRLPGRHLAAVRRAGARSRRRRCLGDCQQPSSGPCTCCFVGRIAERIAAPFVVACGQFLVCGLISLLWAGFSETITLPEFARPLADRLCWRRFGGHRLHRAGDRTALCPAGRRRDHPVRRNRFRRPLRLPADGRSPERQRYGRLRVDSGLHHRRSDCTIDPGRQTLGQQIRHKRKPGVHLAGGRLPDRRSKTMAHLRQEGLCTVVFRVREESARESCLRE
jgi:hypothetical protein